MIFFIVLNHMVFLKYCNFIDAYSMYWHNATLSVDYFLLGCL